MATVNFYVQTDMAHPSIWYGYPYLYNSSELLLSDGYHGVLYYGSGFKYNSNGLTAGTLTGLDSAININTYTLTYTLSSSVRDLNLKATDVQKYIQSGDALGLYQFALSGNDTLSGSNFNDVLTAYNGNDFIDGGSGNDNMIGGSGNDTYIVDSTFDVVTESSNGGTDKIQTNISTYSLASISNVENLSYTSSSHATLTGNTLDNNIVSGSGNDILNGGSGKDTLVGGSGNDTYIVDNTSDVVTESSNAGTDTIQTTLNTYSISSLTNVEHLTFTGSGNATLTGNALNNNITGSSYNDIITGAAGTDNLSGDNGNDLFMVALAADHTSAETINGGSGTDEIRFSATAANTTLTLSSNVTNVENITIGTGTGATAVTTATTALNVVASAVTSALNITGNAGVNSLTGTNYNDTINGGLGNDILTGGTGNDTFVFNSTLNATKNKDTITDFSHRDDTIQLSKLIMGILGNTGDSILNASEFKVSTGTTGVGTITSFDSNDYIIYNQTTGVLYYDVDGSGTKAAIQVALIGTTIHPTDMDYTDFMVV